MSERDPININEWLLRRGRIKQVNPDGTASSRVFTLRDIDNGELSVDAKSMTNFKKSIVDSSAFNLFEISNNKLIELELKTYHHPLPDNNAHSVIVGFKAGDETMPGTLARSSKRIFGEFNTDVKAEEVDQ